MASPAIGVFGTRPAGATSTTIAPGVPAGVVAESLVLIFLYIEGSQAVTAPAGFQEITPAPVTTSQVHTVRVWWRRATGTESGTYTLSWSGSVWRQAVALRVDDALASGDPIDAAAQAQRSTSGTTTPAVSLTTTGPDRRLLWVGSGYVAGGFTPPSGYTEIFDPSVEFAIAHREQATAGATGNVTGTVGSASTQIARLIAISPIDPTVPVDDVGAELGTAAEGDAVTAASVVDSDVSTSAETDAVLTATLKADADTAAGVGGHTVAAQASSSDSSTSAERPSTLYRPDGPGEAAVEGIPVTLSKRYDVDTSDVAAEGVATFGGGTKPDTADTLVEAVGGDILRRGSSFSGVPTPRPPSRARPRLIAQSVLTGQWVSSGLPVTDPQVEWNLSAPTTISGSFRPEIRALSDIGLEPWATWIYLEEDGHIRAAGILQPTQISGDGVLGMSAVGPHGYAQRIPYRDRYSKIGIDPAQIVRDLWAHIQSFPRGALGVTVVGSTPVTKGTEARDVNFVTGEGEVVSFVAGPYTLDYWQNTMIGSEIESLSTETPFDFTEECEWTTAARTAVRKWIRLHYPQAGTRRFDLRFVEGENILEAAPIEEPEDAYADTVYVAGKGEGLDQVAGQASYFVGNRLRLPAVVTDKRIDSTSRANAVALDELRARLAALVEIPEIVVDARHRNAPIGSFALGDEIMPQVRYPYIGQVAQWHRIVGIRYLPLTDRAVLSLTRRGGV